MSYNRPPQETPKFMAIPIPHAPGKLFLKDHNLIVDLKTETVEGSADGINVFGFLMNAMRNITSEQAKSVEKSLKISPGIVNNPVVEPWLLNQEVLQLDIKDEKKEESTSDKPKSRIVDSEVKKYWESAMNKKKEENVKDEIKDVITPVKEEKKDGLTTLREELTTLIKEEKKELKTITNPDFTSSAKGEKKIIINYNSTSSVKKEEKEYKTIKEEKKELKTSPASQNISKVEIDKKESKTSPASQNISKVEIEKKESKTPPNSQNTSPYPFFKTQYEINVEKYKTVIPTEEKNIVFITDNNLNILVDKVTNTVVGSAESVDRMDGGLIKPKRNITKEQYRQVKYDFNIASALIDNPNTVPWLPDPNKEEIVLSLKHGFSAGYSIYPNKIFITEKGLNLIVDEKEKKVEGSADGLDINRNFVNPKRNITGKQARVVSSKLSFAENIIDKPFYTPWKSDTKIVVKTENSEVQTSHVFPVQHVPPHSVPPSLLVDLPPTWTPPPVFPPIQSPPQPVPAPVFPTQPVFPPIPSPPQPVPIPYGKLPIISHPPLKTPQSFTQKELTYLDKEREKALEEAKYEAEQYRVELLRKLTEEAEHKARESCITFYIKKEEEVLNYIRDNGTEILNKWKLEKQNSKAARKAARKMEESIQKERRIKDFGIKNNTVKTNIPDKNYWPGIKVIYDVKTGLVEGSVEGITIDGNLHLYKDTITVEQAIQIGDKLFIKPGITIVNNKDDLRKLNSIPTVPFMYKDETDDHYLERIKAYVQKQVDDMKEKDSKEDKIVRLINGKLQYNIDNLIKVKLTDPDLIYFPELQLVADYYTMEIIGSAVGVNNGKLVDFIDKISSWHAKCIDEQLKIKPGIVDDVNYVTSKFQSTSVVGFSTNEPNIIFLPEAKLVVNSMDKMVIGSAYDVDPVIKNLINYKPYITIEQVNKVPPNLQIKKGIINPQFPPLGPVHLDPIPTNQKNKAFSRTLKIVYDTLTQTVEGSAHEVDNNGELINFRASITPNQVYKVANLLHIRPGIIKEDK